MKVITEQAYQNIVDTILKEKEKQSDGMGQKFQGISSVALQDAVTHFIGDTWVVRRDPKVKFTKSDINAVANSRFYKATGIKLLLALAAAILVVAVLVNTFEGFPVGLAYGLFAAEAIAFVWQYSKRQSKVRKQLWHELGRDENDEV